MSMKQNPVFAGRTDGNVVLLRFWMDSAAIVPDSRA